MTRHSLRMRLALAAAGSILVSLLVAGLGLLTLFEHHVERRIGVELVAEVNQLAAAITLGSDGTLRLESLPAEQRFHIPLSGRYWQIDDATTNPPVIGMLRSRSLWDTPIRLPLDHLEPGIVHSHILPGPGGQTLLVRERLVLLDGGAKAARLMVATDRRELTSARNAFAADMLPYLGLVALVLTLAALVQIQTGLAPLERVRQGVAMIRSGNSQRLDDRFPDEVMPLVLEVNALLAAREQAVERARAWTADLAHGLKTPLSALAADAQRLRAQGNPSLAADLEQLAEAMRRRVDRELVRARVRSGTAAAQAKADVVAASQRLLKTLKRTPDGARLEWRLASPPQAITALMPDDLLELLGNLLENAAKWSRNIVHIQITSGDPIEIQITDDGPGVPPEQRHRLGQRGLRLDQGKDGSGLGLAIVRDVTDAYGGRLDFESGDQGGLVVRVQLPPTGSASTSL